MYSWLTQDLCFTIGRWRVGYVATCNVDRSGPSIVWRRYDQGRRALAWARRLLRPPQD